MQVIGDLRAGLGVLGGEQNSVFGGSEVDAKDSKFSWVLLGVSGEDGSVGGDRVDVVANQLDEAFTGGVALDRFEPVSGDHIGLRGANAFIGQLCDCAELLVGSYE